MSTSILGQWNFTSTNAFKDQSGNWSDLKLMNRGTLTQQGLRLASNAWARVSDYTGPNFTEKTLVVWIIMNDLENSQPKGAAMSISAPADGDKFDAIVFGEREAHTWMAGSNHFVRTLTDPSQPGAVESSTGEIVKMAVSYRLQGGKAAVTLYRNDELIADYVKGDLPAYKTGKIDMLFGPRHGKAGHINGTVVAAQLIGESLDAAGIAALQMPAAIVDSDPTIPDGLVRGQWNFTSPVGYQEQTGLWSDLEFQGGESPERKSLRGSLSSQGLELANSAHARARGYTGPEIREKTMVVWLKMRLDANASSAGAAMSLDNLSGDNFDAIVFGEKDAQKWLAGSTQHTRSKLRQGSAPVEDTVGELIQLATTYLDIGDGNVEVSLYRNGELLSRYRKGKIASWQQGAVEVLFGPRHTDGATVAGYLDATIAGAVIYGAPLTSAQLAAVPMPAPAAVPAREPITEDDYLGRWDFRVGTQDLVGKWGDVELRGASRTDEGLVLNKDQWARARGYQGQDVIEKTMIAWIKLHDLDDKRPAGAAIALDRQGIDHFDAIVIGEQKDLRWGTGSTHLVRTSWPLVASAIEDTARELVQVAAVYEKTADGKARISMYRNGELLALYIKDKLASWTEADVEVLFGPRRAVGDVPDGHFNGTVVAASLLGRAVSSAQLGTLTPDSWSDQQPTSFSCQVVPVYRLWNPEEPSASTLVTTDVAYAVQKRGEGYASIQVLGYVLAPIELAKLSPEVRNQFVQVNGYLNSNGVFSVRPSNPALDATIPADDQTVIGYVATTDEFGVQLVNWSKGASSNTNAILTEGSSEAAVWTARGYESQFVTDYHIVPASVSGSATYGPLTVTTTAPDPEVVSPSPPPPVTQPQPSTLTLQPLYCAFSPSLRDHCYTTSREEWERLIHLGWQDRGIAAYVFPRQLPDSLSFQNLLEPLYRMVNTQSGDHFYTTSAQVHADKVSEGYTSEGIIGHTLASGVAADFGFSQHLAPLYQLYNVADQDHYYTTSHEDVQEKLASGEYTDKKVVTHVFPASLGIGTGPSTFAGTAGVFFSLADMDVRAKWEEIDGKLQTELSGAFSDDNDDAASWRALEVALRGEFKRRVEAVARRGARLELMLQHYRSMLDARFDLSFKTWVEHFKREAERRVTETVTETVDREIAERIAGQALEIKDALKVDVKTDVQARVANRIALEQDLITATLMTRLREILENEVKVRVEAKLGGVKNDVVVQITNDITEVVKAVIAGQSNTGDITVTIDIDGKVQRLLDRLTAFEGQFRLEMGAADTDIQRWILAQVNMIKGCMTDRHTLTERLIALSDSLESALPNVACVQPVTEVITDPSQP